LPQATVLQVAGWARQRPAALSPQCVDALMAEVAADLLATDAQSTPAERAGTETSFARHDARLAGKLQRTPAERARTEAFFAQHDANAVEENSLMEALNPDPFALAALANLSPL
jgi:hypothetical protein